MSGLRKSRLARAIVIVIGIATIGLLINSLVRKRIEMGYVGTIRKTLSLYYKDNGRYPQDLGVLVKHYGLKQELTLNCYYFPSDNYGTYSLSYHDKYFWGFVTGFLKLRGPPPSEQSHEVLANSSRFELRFYYAKYGRYPDTLLEGITPQATELKAAIKKEEFVYSVSEDQQSYSLDGEESGPTSPSRLFPVWKDANREKRIYYLTLILKTYRKENGRYPETLKELTGSGIRYAHRMDEILEGADFEYHTSANGKEAFLDGKKIEK